MITEKLKNFILDNIDILDIFTLQEIIEHLINNMKKDYASELIKNMIENLNDDSSYLNIFDTF